MKNERQEAILEIIDRYDIQKQEELIKYLRDRGIEATQATVSRDIRELKLMKGSGQDGIHKYVRPTRKQNTVPRFNSALTESIVRIDTSENIIVIKTLPGMANAVGACIDSFNIPEILGCVAGDDAILAVISDKTRSIALRDKIRRMLETV